MMDSETSVYTDAALLLEWLQQDIAARGGSGRRASKANLQFGWGPDRLNRAIDYLAERALIEVEYYTGAAFGFAYLVPR